MMDPFIRFFNQNNSIFAVNQKDALEQMKSVSIQAKPAATQSGYIVAPVAGSRILDATLLSARISGVTADDQVTFVLSGKTGRSHCRHRLQMAMRLHSLSRIP